MPTAKPDPQLHPDPNIIDAEDVSNLNPFLISRLVCLGAHSTNPLKRLVNIGTIAVASSLVSVQPSNLLSTLCCMTLEKEWTSLVLSGIISGGLAATIGLCGQRGAASRGQVGPASRHPVSQPRISHPGGSAES